MKTIYKYPLNIEDEQAVLMPEHALILMAGLDPQGQLCVWAAVNTDKPLIPRFICIYGTGHPIEEEEGYDLVSIDSVVIKPFVWHVFQKVYSKDNG